MEKLGLSTPEEIEASKMVNEQSKTKEGSNNPMKRKLQQTINGFSKINHHRNPSDQYFPKLGKQTTSNFNSTLGFTQKTGFPAKEKDLLYDVGSMKSTDFGNTGAITANFTKTGFKRRNNSVINLGATLGINHPDSRFILSVSKKDMQLKSFVDAGNKIATDEKVAKVANRSQFWEGNSGQVINKPLKDQINYLQDWKALDLLQDAMEKSNFRDIRVLEDKNKNLMEELNKTFAANKEKEARKNVLKTTMRDLEANNRILLDDSAQTLDKLSREMRRLENNSKLQEENKLRMDLIIDICKINQVQNVDWVRGLEFYSRNLKQVINLQAKTNNKIESEKQKVEEEIERVKEEYLENVHKHQIVITDVSHAIGDFRHLKENIYNTNGMIKSRIEERNHEISELLIGRKRVKDKELHRREHEANEEKIKRDLQAITKEHGKYKEIFMAGPDGQDWESKPEIKTLVANLESHRAMSVALFHKQSEIEYIKQGNKALQDKITVDYLH